MICVITRRLTNTELIASPSITTSLVNGGDGSVNIPSFQSYLIWMTIYEEFGHFEGLKVAIAGDLTSLTR